MHIKEHKNVALVLRAIEHLIGKDEDSIQRLVQYGFVVKMLNWFEIASEHLKEQLSPQRDALQLVEVFYEVAMSLCQSPISDSNMILDIFLLRFGAVVLDNEMVFCLRLEAIRTINSILDGSPKELRKKLCHSDDHVGLLDDMAKTLTDIGDYEMQVAITEALCRMTPKKLREDFGGKWFGFRSFTSAFTSINDKDFETHSSDILLFKLVSCPTESSHFRLVKPEDEFLKEFWVDFNIGTSSISFYVNDPQSTLWQLIHLPQDTVSVYDLQEINGEKILIIHVKTPVSHGGISGKIIKISFSSEHNVQTALNKVFGSKPQLPSPSKDTLLPGDGLMPIKEREETETPLSVASERRIKATTGQDIFYFKDHSDSEVALAKTMSFCRSSSSNGSTQSLPDSLSQTPLKRKMRIQSNKGSLHKDTPIADYSRRKSRVKGKLKVLPLSSPSSNEEEFSKKFSTPRKTLGSKDWCEVKLGSQDMPMESSLLKETMADSGFQNQTVFESSFQTEEADAFQGQILEQVQTTDAVMSPLLNNDLNEDMPLASQTPQQPRRLFFSKPLEEAADRVSEALTGDQESEEELGVGVKAAFNSFKTQLKAHFSSRYKKIEARSLQSLTDCQRNVSSLLGSVHNQRLIHLEQFQSTVVQQLECLEQDCLSLKAIEKETVNFWQSESNTVRAFCDEQHKRLHTLLVPPTSAEAKPMDASNQKQSSFTSSPENTTVKRS
ncbi:hypothetical protein DNTS_035774 [Danionella cerebrum]|uniref:Synaptonemal complex protein 2 Spt16M-like domain-containing protein n=1 Tax=Danionella cerebrum TaxID=2873325 RepID=A0A553QM32_9TELE|nr:hypothetical protein DNTS_035774 [Danionella translucida]